MANKKFISVKPITGREKETITAYAFQLGKSIDAIITEGIYNGRYKEKELQGLILGFRTKLAKGSGGLHDRLLEEYDNWFKIERHTHGRI